MNDFVFLFGSFADSIRFCYPFGRPEGALKATLSLLERVLMKDVITPAPPTEVRTVIKKCLESAALVNYTDVCKNTQIEPIVQDATFDPHIKLQHLITHAERCVELIQESNEHYAEVSMSI